MSKIHHLENALTKVEFGFNIAGSLPIVGMFSGALRATLGKIQFIAAGVFAGISLIGKALSKKESRDNWNARFELSVEHMSHGSLNFMRGVAESFLGWTFYGSFFPLLLQGATDENFNPRFEYASVKCRIFAPLNPSQ